MLQIILYIGILRDFIRRQTRIEKIPRTAQTAVHTAVYVAEIIYLKH